MVSMEMERRRNARHAAFGIRRRGSNPAAGWGGSSLLSGETTYGQHQRRRRRFGGSSSPAPNSSVITLTTTTTTTAVKKSSTRRGGGIGIGWPQPRHPRGGGRGGGGGTFSSSFGSGRSPSQQQQHQQQQQQGASSSSSSSSLVLRGRSSKNMGPQENAAAAIPFFLGDEAALRLQLEATRYVLDHGRPFATTTTSRGRGDDDDDSATTIVYGVPMIDVVYHVLRPVLLMSSSAPDHPTTTTTQKNRTSGGQRGLPMLLLSSVLTRAQGGNRNRNNNGEVLRSRPRHGGTWTAARPSPWSWWGGTTRSNHLLSAKERKEHDIRERYQLLDTIDRLHNDLLNIPNGSGTQEDGGADNMEVDELDWRTVVFERQAGHVTGWEQIRQVLVQGNYFSFPATADEEGEKDETAATAITTHPDPVLDAYERRLVTAGVESMGYDLLPSQRILLDIATHDGIDQYDPMDHLKQGEEGEDAPPPPLHGRHGSDDDDRAEEDKLSMEQRLLEMTQQHEARHEKPSVRAIKESILKEQEAAMRAGTLLRPLTEDELEMVHDALYGTDGTDDDIMAREGSDSVSRASLKKLAPRQWLNDETIHFFLLMLAKRDAELCEHDPSRKRSHFFKSFFFTKLLQEGHALHDGVYDYKSVKRWSRHVPGKDIFALEKIFFPINVGRSHWVCAVVYMQDRRIEFHDSLGADGMEYMEHLLHYLQDEHLDKKKAPLPDPEGWTLVPCDPRETPQQLNGYDCGVFTCMFADFLSKDCPLVFEQEHITQCRERIALAILKGQAIV